MARRAKARRKERICTFDALLTVGLGAVGLITLGQGSRGLARSFASHAAAPSEAPAPLLYLLHVPSSGGTTLCRAAEQFGMRVNSRDNCNLPGGNRAPAALALSGMAVIASADANTTAADARAARRHCRVMRRAGFELVANEIGLPVPPLAMLWTRGVVYAIAVRHPTLRALSAFGRAASSRARGAADEDEAAAGVRV